MSEYKNSLVIEASPEQVFNFVSDPHNLPKYLPTVHSAMPQPGARVRVIGDTDGQQYDRSGRYYVDDAHRKMEWSFDGERKYSGWLEVKRSAGGRQAEQAELAVHLSFESQQDAGDHDRAIREGLEGALESIKNIVEGRGGKVTSKASGR